MKKLWKALGFTALAAIVPVRLKKDGETGKTTAQSLLWKLDVGPDKDGTGTKIDLGLMDGVLTAPLMNAINAKKEAELFTDNPEEAVVTEPVDAPAAEETKETPETPEAPETSETSEPSKPAAPKNTFWP